MIVAVDSFFSRVGLASFGFRWLHILAGITWIGLLYYFNFVQVPAFAEYGDEGRARNFALDKVARRALWWFRWAALATFLTGIIIVGLTEDYFGSNVSGAAKSGILAGMLLGTIMMLNVWGVIWRNQKIVLANAANLIAGGAADPGAAAAGRRAFLASRQNTLFSIAMVWFMVFRSHSTYNASDIGGGKLALFWIIFLVLVAIMEINALGLMPWKFEAKKGLNLMYETVQNVLVAGFVFWAINLIIWEIIK
jgi:uncharacterized membrane protein